MCLCLLLLCAYVFVCVCVYRSGRTGRGNVLGGESILLYDKTEYRLVEKMVSTTKQTFKLQPLSEDTKQLSVDRILGRPTTAL